MHAGGLCDRSAQTREGRLGLCEMVRGRFFGAMETHLLVMLC